MERTGSQELRADRPVSLGTASRQPGRLGRVCLLALTLSAGLARAAPWELKLGGGASYGSTFHPMEADGYGAHGYAELGLSEMWSLLLAGGYQEHTLGKGNRYSFEQVGLGLVYALDVLSVLPFISVRLEWLQKRWQQNPAEAGLGYCVGGGFDVSLFRHLTVGFAGEYHGSLNELSFNYLPGYVSFNLRLGVRFFGKDP